MRIGALVIILVINAVKCKEDTEAEFRRLPKLFHLDDFDKCLIRKDGLYCLGIFEIYNEIENNPVYDLILEKARDPRLYNRTLLHRGYCLPTRCPNGEANVTARFERCVDTWARTHALRTRLQKLHYCRAHAQPIVDTNDLPHQAFLYVVYALLIMNIVGTAYDLMMGQKTKKNKLLMMFSLRVNFIRLLANQETFERGMRGLQVLNGYKAVLLYGAVVAHSGIITAMAYQYNPRFPEKFLASPVGGMIGAMTTATQLFILMSHFLTAYNLLVMSNKHKMSLAIVPVLFLKRLLRMLPIYLLLNGFTATWWTSFGDGPSWPMIVGDESQICREKFWYQALFLQNWFQNHRICNVQTWIMAVDIQLYIPSLIITILLIKKRRWALPILFSLLGAATVLTGYVTLANQYKPTFTYMTPANFRVLFENDRNFTEFFLMPINCLITMMMGILLGFMYFNKRERMTKAEKKSNVSKFVLFLHLTLVPMIFIWCYLCGLLIMDVQDPVFMALMMPIERLTVALFGFLFIYTSTNVKSVFTSFFTWRSFRVLGRVSMSISMVHWAVNKILVGNRSLLHDSSLGLLTLDTIGVFVISYVIAVPLTVIVEYPMTKLADKLLSFLM
ncbi:O-acyltransferase like protein-like [Ostrinia nubilalis]|uniref:O-acyltransferase like protein-like n=1 Tax=Ostrinia nubilalis TaxID=29057 RepID=UPI0030826227